MNETKELALMDIYEAREDSYLLEKEARKHFFGRVLDMGTGSGIQALAAIENPNVKEVVAVDINPHAVAKLKDEITQRKLRKFMVVESDLFENVEGCFNVIVFNPPYLPQDEGIEDLALYGGKEGWEILERFFSQVSTYLFPGGRVIFLFSSLTRKSKVEEILSHHLFEWKELVSEKHHFETLYVYEAVKNDVLRSIEGKLVRDVTCFAKGKRGIIYKGVFDLHAFDKSQLRTKKLVDVAIKAKNAQSVAHNTIQNEAYWLKQLNRKGIGPRYVLHTDDFVVYQFVKGDFILDWITQQNDSQKIMTVLRDLLTQCRILDEMGVSKEEMHHPLKHVLVTTAQNVVQLDFERCHRTEKPQNVTQCVEFISRMEKNLLEKGISLDVGLLRTLSQQYKKTYSDENFNHIMTLFS